MTQDFQTGQPSTPQPWDQPHDEQPGQPGSAKDAARDAAHTAQEQAANVAQSAKESGHHLVGEAKDQARDVGREAGRQAKDVLDASREELTQQAAAQQKKVAGGLRAFGGELGTMADASDEPGVASDLARQLAGRVDAAASWLDDREPGALLEEVKTFARQRPGTFLALAAGAGLLAGRLTRGLKDAPSDDEAPGAGQAGTATAPLSSAAPSRASAFAAPGAPGAATAASAYAASGATYGASADETAAYGPGHLQASAAESAAWDEAAVPAGTEVPGGAPRWTEVHGDHREGDGR